MEIYLDCTDVQHGDGGNYSADDAEHCTFGGYYKNMHFLFKGHNLAKIIQQ